MEFVRAERTSASRANTIRSIVSDYVIRPQSRIVPCRIFGKRKPTSRYRSAGRNLDSFRVADDTPGRWRTRAALHVPLIGPFELLGAASARS
jgi:hypothetical protein